MAKRRKIEEVAELCKLLDLNPYDEGDRRKVDGDAIIQAAQRDPNSTESKYIFLGDHSRPRFCFPLHQAIRLGARVDVISALCSTAALDRRVGNHAIPRGKLHQDETALHVALKWGSPLAVIKLLLKKKKELVWEKNREGYTPLHVACHSKAPFMVVSLLINTWPGAILEKDISGNTPLHISCDANVPLEVISLLIKTWPAASQQKNDNEVTPLHIACNRTGPLEVISLLINTWPEGLQKRIDGATPLHIACNRTAPLEIISFLANKWPGALQQKDFRGFTPLHVACSNKSPLEVVSFLANKWPDALQQQTSKGNTPLHEACCNKVQLDVLLPLLSLWPGATTQKNKNNMIPFHLAENNETASEDTKTLLCLVSSLFDKKMNHPSPNEIIVFFTKLSWWKGVGLALDRYPLATKTIGLPTNVMADFLSTVGRYCRLNTVWRIICHEPELLASV